MRKAVVGAQAQGFNSQTTGVASIGTHTSVAVSPEERRPIVATSPGSSRCTGLGRRQDDADLGRRRASRYPKGAGSASTGSSATGRSGLTACPGEALKAEIPGSAARIQARIDEYGGLARRRGEPAPQRRRREPALAGSARGSRGRSRRRSRPAEALVGRRVADDLVGAKGSSRLAKPRLNSSRPSPGLTPPPRLSGRPSSSARSSIATITFLNGDASRAASAVPPR